MYYFKGRGFLWHDTKGPVVWWPLNWIWFGLFEMKRLRDDRREERAARKAAKAAAKAGATPPGVSPPTAGPAGGP